MDYPPPAPHTQDLPRAARRYGQPPEVPYTQGTLRMRRRIRVRWDAVLTAIAAFGAGIAVGGSIALQLAHGVG